MFRRHNSALFLVLIVASALSTNAVVAEVPGGSHGISNKLEFDTCTTPSVATMQAWWNSSPYHDVGVYLGGVSYPTQFCSNANFTAAWVDAVSDQGWSFLPIWVGPQAPCGNFAHKIDASRAFDQGKGTADNAASAASARGFTKGTIIYLDIEYFDASNVSCRNAVNAFVSGWSDELRNVLGSNAGVYGAGSDVQYWWDGTSTRPNDVWIAAWNQTTHEGASVWQLPFVPDVQWVTDRRHHQFQGDHTHTYGGITLNVDDDCGDGMVTPHGNEGEEPIGFTEQDGPLEDPSC